MTPPLPHRNALAPLAHPARPGADRINLQFLAAAYVRAMLRSERPQPQPAKQIRLEGVSR